MRPVAGSNVSADVPIVAPAGKPRPSVLSVTVATRPDLAAAIAFDQELRQGADVRSIWVDAAAPSGATAEVLARADSADYVVVGSYLGQGTLIADVGASDPLVELIHSTLARNRRTIVVAFGNPYLYQQIPFVPTYLVAWSGFAPSQRAAARALLGAAEISGRLPISIPPALRLGDGEQRQLRTTP